MNIITSDTVQAVVVSARHGDQAAEPDEECKLSRRTIEGDTDTGKGSMFR